MGLHRKTLQPATWEKNDYTLTTHTVDLRLEKAIRITMISVFLAQFNSPDMAN